MRDGPVDSLYREVVLDHHRSPRGNAPLSDFDVEAAGKNPSCGDEVVLQLRFAGERIAAVGVLSRGCAISTSSGSMLAEIIEGLSIPEASRVADTFKQLLRGEEIPDEIDLGDLIALEGVRNFPVRLKCALLPWVTLLDAVMAHRTGRMGGDQDAESVGVEDLTITLKDCGHAADA